MKKAILAQKVLASVLAVGLGGFVLPLAAQANSGLREGTEEITGTDYYVGSKGAENNVVIIDSDLPDKDAGVIGGYGETEEAANNSVAISGGEVGNIYGGRASYGNATGNEVSISGSVQAVYSF